MNKPATSPKYFIPNLANACRVLKWLGTTDKPASVGQIAVALKVPRTTVLRIVTTLESEGLVIAQADGFALGAGLIPLGLNALAGIDLRRAAQPVLAQLAQATGESTHVAIPAHGFKSLLVEVCQSPNPVRAGAPAGTLVDLYCSSTGKVFLTELYSDRLAEILKTCPPVRHTPHTHVTVAGLKREITGIRRLGYAVDEEEFAPGVRCIAAPVRNAAGETIAALGVTGPASRVSPERTESLAKLVCAAARKISLGLGHAPGPAQV